jgi:FRG domain
VSEDKIRKLSEFVACVHAIREGWPNHEHKELWFRGESKKHETILRPKLYRPARGSTNIKPILDLLEIENSLYKDFVRCGIQLCEQRLEEQDRDWDWYFLMQHHGAPTRLLDWSDGALIALHFALKSKHDTEDAQIYALEPDRLQDRLKAFPEIEMAKQRWELYKEKHPFHKSREDEWEYAYLPSDREDLEELPVPRVPLLLDFPHITRRVAAQRSRFIVFGTEPTWLSEELGSTDSLIKAITIESSSISNLRIELRDSGVTESVIFPDLDGLGREINQVWEDRK